MRPVFRRCRMSAQHVNLSMLIVESPRIFQAAVFDLDGVVTRTADLHAAAWKRVFDDYLETRSSGDEARFRPFDIESDYRATVDGRPRYEGVRTFLLSRGIELPFGSEDDPPNVDTICGLGNRKNQIFKRLLKDQGARVLEPNVEFVRSLRRSGISTALVTSSRNGRAIIEATGIGDLFDAVIDGNDAARLELRGKPSPDTFLEALSRIGGKPSRSLLVEDAVSGVEAGHAAGFGCIVALGDPENADRLSKAGADLVVNDLSELDLNSPCGELPDAIDHLKEIEAILSGHQPAIFLDYDGTLSPIAERPELALIPVQTRRLLARLAKLCTIAVVSGRGLADVRAKVGLPDLIYAGSHGFEIDGPDVALEHPDAVQVLPELDRTEERLAAELADVRGVIVERKRFAIAVHYRMADPGAVSSIEERVQVALDKSSGLRRRMGKKVFELVPALQWDKGRAVLWLLEALGQDKPGVIPLYIGDDRTDEDAFAAVRERGLGIVVAGPTAVSKAAYRLSDTEAVVQFLDHLAQLLERTE